MALWEHKGADHIPDKTLNEKCQRVIFAMHIHSNLSQLFEAEHLQRFLNVTALQEASPAAASKWNESFSNSLTV